MPDVSRPPLLARAVLEAQLVRARVLAISLAVAAGVLGTAMSVQWFFQGSSWVPPAVLPLVILFAALQLLLARFLAGRLESPRSIPERFWLGVALAEVTFVTFILIGISVSFTPGVLALASPAVFLYFIFIIFSTLRLEPRICVFTGVMAALQFLGVALVLLRFASDPGLHRVIRAPLPHAAKALMLVGGGVGAAFVARELRRRLVEAIAADRERDRVERADRAKTSFLAQLSHEIRAPLNSVVGYAHLLMRDPELSPDQRHAVAGIDAGGRHLLGVINQVLDLSRIEAGFQEATVEAFDLDEMMREISSLIEPRCRQKGLAWSVTAAPSGAEADGSLVLGDPDRLRQVLLNLLENAIRVTEQGGVEVEVRRTGEGFEFHVSDSGPGIREELRSTIFEPFQQQREMAGSAGLGLAIARAQTELMNGALRLADSRVGVGSRFVVEVELPPAPPHTVPDPAADLMILADGVEVTALVVEDRSADREVVSALLEEIGVDVTEAESTAEALTVLRADRPDVLFSDIQLDREDGRELLARAVAEGVRPRLCVAVSASALEHERRAVLDSGFDHFIAKPARTRDFAAALKLLPGVRLAKRAGPWESKLGGRASGKEGPMEELEPVPRSLWLQLRNAAEAYSITDLKRGLSALHDLGPEAQPLREELQALARTYDMERIVEVLDRVPHV